jgi:ABC-2 type transport system ATP-binding protein
MGRGRVLAIGTLPEIRNMLQDHPLHVRVRSPQVRDIAAQLILWPLVKGIELRGDEELSVEVFRPDEFFRRFADIVVEERYDVSCLETTDASAEAIFEYVMSAAARF